MKDTKLKTCPFCGAQADQPENITPRLDDAAYGEWWQIMCSNTDCRAWRAGASPALAAAEWNKRAGRRQWTLGEPGEKAVGSKDVLSVLREQLIAIVRRADYVCNHRFGAKDPVGTRVIAVCDLKDEIRLAKQLLRSTDNAAS